MSDQASPDTDPQSLILVVCGSRRCADIMLREHAQVSPRHPRLRYAFCSDNLRAMPRGTLYVDLIEEGRDFTNVSKADLEDMRATVVARAYTRLSLDGLASKLAASDKSNAAVA